MLLLGKDKIIPCNILHKRQCHSLKPSNLHEEVQGYKRVTELLLSWLLPGCLLSYASCQFRVSLCKSTYDNSSYKTAHSELFTENSCTSKLLQVGDGTILYSGQSYFPVHTCNMCYRPTNDDLRAAHCQ
eukprot:TRINITY_DN10979_c0_g1_i1.p1 TRINITY_DN10979_c0_g1~~TRINITY_DN10979_c0_g1_i1.p1  ORF type:complete len:129 (-),score=7.24 TRINITY_DN10979_c0_g1_i1:23-409(-)